MTQMDSHWMPFTGNRDFKSAPRIVARAEGAYYYDADGRKILDGVSGLFTCAAGHCRPEIAEAIGKQAAELDYVPHFNTGTEKAFALADKLAGLLPDGIDRVFFVCDGSGAVDSAIKIARAYHLAKGEGRRIRLVSRERAYHGVNIGGTSLSGMINNRAAFGPGLAEVSHIRHTWLPENRFCPGRPPNGGADLAGDLERQTQLYGAHNIAACFVEPVAGSFGVLPPPSGYLERLREICDAHGILLVFDEVITGFGRIGEAFAAQTFGVVPDIITMAKALTNGAAPMGAVAVRNEIYDTITAGAPPTAIELFHGYTYSAHPLACAAAAAALDLYEKEDIFARGREIAPYFQEQVFSLREEFPEIITDIRGVGMLAGFDIKPEKGAPGARGRDFYQTLFHAGLHLKTTADAAILAPPLVAEKSHIDEMMGLLRGQLAKYPQ
jgi:beta-alanine--pyruvate transaminase